MMSKRTNDSVLDQIDTRAFDGSGSAAADALREAGRQMSQFGGTVQGLADAARAASKGSGELDTLLRKETKRRAARRKELMRYAAYYAIFLIIAVPALIALTYS